MHAVSAGVNPSFVKGEYQLNLGNNSLTRIQIISMINLYNSSKYLYYSMEEIKYFPKIYEGYLVSRAEAYLYDSKYKTPISTWPEIK